ncbi:MAG: hypothetical protein MJA30_12655 [Cytophagales bacterium]|nr:hypothetical protein [Cytophagales bacterium]
MNIFSQKGIRVLFLSIIALSCKKKYEVVPNKSIEGATSNIRCKVRTGYVKFGEELAMAEVPRPVRSRETSRTSRESTPTTTSSTSTNTEETNQVKVEEGVSIRFSVEKPITDKEVKNVKISHTWVSPLAPLLCGEGCEGQGEDFHQIFREASRAQTTTSQYCRLRRSLSLARTPTIITFEVSVVKESEVCGSSRATFLTGLRKTDLEMLLGHLELVNQNGGGSTELFSQEIDSLKSRLSASPRIEYLADEEVDGIRESLDKVCHLLEQMKEGSTSNEGADPSQQVANSRQGRRRIAKIIGATTVGTGVTLLFTRILNSRNNER